MKSFIAKAQLSYHPIIWINYSRKLGIEIDRMHEKTLRVLHNNKVTCVKLFAVNKSVRIHTGNVLVLVTEISSITIYYERKFPNGLSWCL